MKALVKATAKDETDKQRRDHCRTQLANLAKGKVDPLEGSSITTHIHLQQAIWDFMEEIRTEATTHKTLRKERRTSQDQTERRTSQDPDEIENML